MRGSQFSYFEHNKTNRKQSSSHSAFDSSLATILTYFQTIFLEELAMINEDERAETRGQDHLSLYRSVDETDTADNWTIRW